MVELRYLPFLFLSREITLYLILPFFFVRFIACPSSRWLQDST